MGDGNNERVKNYENMNSKMASVDYNRFERKIERSGGNEIQNKKLKKEKKTW